MTTTTRIIKGLPDAIGLVVVAAVLAALLALGIGIGPGIYTTLGEGGTNNDDLQTPADVIHPNIHQNNNGSNNANPNGANDGGGNMHGIANNPGQSGTNPNDDGTNGFANQLQNVHGGIGAYNPQAG